MPEVTVPRAAEPPVIDGRLDDPAWARAAVIDELHQVLPVENAAPSERTEILLAYDRDMLYVAFRCHDREPAAIISTTRIRDGDLDSDDRVSFVLDPYFDRRNGFFFEINPGGARVDALVENSDRLREDWDGIWYGRARLDETGWTAEIAVPYKTISFNPATTRWGFNAARVIRRRTETVRWAATVQNKSLIAMADAGILSGLEDLSQGAGIDLVPFGLSRFTHRDGEDRFELDGGLDLFYKLAPTTTLALTLNTDFAETEVDARQVNLTRFPLFFPEKRDFFLQDAGIFDFGGINRNPLTFHSRRIGIGPDGRQRDILGGAKLTGRVGDVNFGALSVQMKDDETLGRRNLGAGRLALNVLEESTLGVIGTFGDPAVRGENWVVGSDFNYRFSRYGGDKVIESHAWFLQSGTSNDGRDDRGGAAGFKLGYPNDLVDWEVGFTQIDEDFNPALGFVPRGGIREYFASGRRRWRPQTWVRSLDVGFFGLLVTDLDDELESSTLSFPIDVETESNDTFGLTVSLEREQLVAPFEISEGVVVPPGDYRFARWFLGFGTSRSRPVSLDLGFEAGEFFSGTRLESFAEIEWRLSPSLFLSFEYEQNDVDLDEGDFVTRLARARVNVFFTPDLSWSNFVQYDNVSDTLGLNSRVRWIIEPGNELFFVVNQGWAYDEGSLRAEVTEVTTKLGWTLRF